VLFKLPRSPLAIGRHNNLAYTLPPMTSPPETRARIKILVGKERPTRMRTSNKRRELLFGFLQTGMLRYLVHGIEASVLRRGNKIPSIDRLSSETNSAFSQGPKGKMQVASVDRVRFCFAMTDHGKPSRWLPTLMTARPQRRDGLSDALVSRRSRPWI